MRIMDTVVYQHRRRIDTAPSYVNTKLCRRRETARRFMLLVNDQSNKQQNLAIFGFTNVKT